MLLVLVIVLSILLVASLAVIFCIKRNSAKQNEDLQSQLEDTKEKLQEALSMANATSDARDLFIKNISYDVRTPLNSIIGFTSLAKKNSEDPQKVREYLGKVDISSESLLNLFNNILDVSRIESGRAILTDEPNDIRKIISRVEERIMPDIRLNSQIYTSDCSGISENTVMCDAHAILEILNNILGNAVKFTPECGRINLTVSQKNSHDNDYINHVFKITDSGIGMSEEFKKKLFLPFEKDEKAKKNGISGSGLGLHITKNLVDMLGGSIEVSSKDLMGTEVVVELPLRKCNKDALSEKPSTSGDNNEAGKAEVKVSGRTKKILLVEDNDLNRELAHEILSEQGYDVVTAINGKEALDAVISSGEGEYDLVLMDIQMPVMDGIEATEKIRKLEDPKKNSIPILAMSANVFENNTEVVKNAGMNGFLSKPIDVSKLADSLKEHIKDE
ncbi:MAG: response regulator [Lachnospiraceae bacterium]|nr:response regulator [Lachnospiraceae bacterium]